MVLNNIHYSKWQKRLKLQMVQPILQMPDRFVNVSHRSKGLSFYKNLPFGWFFKIKRTRKFLPWQWIQMFELWNQYVKKSWRVMLNISNEKLKPADWMSILQKRQSELKTKDFKRRKNWSTFIFSLHSEENIHYGSSMILEGKTPRSLYIFCGGSSPGKAPQKL